MCPIILPFDLGDYERKEYVQLPVGYYLAEIIDVKDNTDKEKPNILVSFKVVDTPAGKEDFIGSKVYDVFFINEKAIWKIAQFLDAVFNTVIKGNTFPDKEYLTGKKVIVTIRKELYFTDKETSIQGYNNELKWQKYKGLVPKDSKLKENIIKNQESQQEEENDDEDIPF